MGTEYSKCATNTTEEQTSNLMILTDNSHKVAKGYKDAQKCME